MPVLEVMGNYTETPNVRYLDRRFWSRRPQRPSKLYRLLPFLLVAHKR